MKKVWKYLQKPCLVCLMTLCFLMSYKIAVKANNISFDNWYADSYQVGYWSQAPKVYFTNLSSAINVSTYLNNAVNKWSSAGISSSITTTSSNATIKFYGGTQSELISAGFYYTSNTAGLTYWDSYSTVATANSYYSIKELTATSASVCSEIGSSYYTNVVLHEYGHALGWYGHASSTGDVMYYEATAENTSLTTHDKNHLTQVYNAMN